MDKTTEVRELVRAAMAEDIALSGVTENDVEYVIKATEKGFDVTLGKDKFKVAGDKRLTVTVDKPKAKAKPKPKAKAKPKAAKIDTECSDCGKTFKLSKFTPYLNICPACRKERVKAGKYLDPKGQIEVVCEVTGKKFKTSKYTPYVKVSPEGRKILAEKAKAKAKPKAAAKK